MRIVKPAGSVILSLAAVACAGSSPSSPPPAPARGAAETAVSAAPTVPVKSLRERATALSALNVARVDRLLLPAMRKAGIDCWIIMSRENNVDFVLDYLIDEPPPTGGFRNAYIFFDDGTDRLRRLVIGTYLFRPSRIYDRQIEYRGGQDPRGPSLAPELRKVIEEFKPKRIGVNQSRTIPMCDGLTVEMRKYLEQAIGPVYASRLVPAESMIVDLLETRLPEERALFTEAASITRMLHEEVLSDRLVTPGKTTLLDLTWYMNDRLAELTLPTWFTPIVSLRRPDGETYAYDAVVQPGDILHTDIGIVYAGLATDYQHNAYVLKPGETAPPPGLVQAFTNALAVQDAVIELAKPGAIGYQVKEAAEALARTRGVQPSVYSHSVAIGGHGIGALISADWPDRWGDRVRFPLRAGAYYSIESSATTPLPEWGGRPITLATEEDMLLTDAGLQHVIPRQQKLYVIGAASSGSRR